MICLLSNNNASLVILATQKVWNITDRCSEKMRLVPWEHILGSIMRNRNIIRPLGRSRSHSRLPGSVVNCLVFSVSLFVTVFTSNTRDMKLTFVISLTRSAVSNNEGRNSRANAVKIQLWPGDTGYVSKTDSLFFSWQWPKRAYFFLLLYYCYICVYGIRRFFCYYRSRYFSSLFLIKTSKRVIFEISGYLMKLDYLSFTCFRSISVISEFKSTHFQFFYLR